jgi:hypothetical protein
MSDLLAKIFFLYFVGCLFRLVFDREEGGRNFFRNVENLHQIARRYISEYSTKVWGLKFPIRNLIKVKGEFILELN